MVNDGIKTKESAKKYTRRVERESKGSRRHSAASPNRRISRRRSNEILSNRQRRGSADSNSLLRSRAAHYLISSPRTGPSTTAAAAAAATSTSNGAQDFTSCRKLSSSPRRNNGRPDTYSPSRSSRSSRKEQNVSRRATDGDWGYTENRRKVDEMMMAAFETRKDQAWTVRDAHNSGITTEIRKKSRRTNVRKTTEPPTNVQTTENDWRNSRVGWLVSFVSVVLFVGGIVSYFATIWSKSTVPAALEPTISPLSAGLRTQNPFLLRTVPPTVTPTTTQPALTTTRDPTPSHTPSPPMVPSKDPTPLPTPSPTMAPSKDPTISPTPSPTMTPSKDPTPSPTPWVSHFQPLDRPIRIACAGDSLTRGKSGGVAGVHTYPFQLQEMLGEDFEVFNFGRNAMTALRGLSVSYVNTAQFQASLNVQPDIYLLMLGTNDAKYWQVHGKEYRGDMEWIVDKVRSISIASPARIILAVPPWVKIDGTFGIRNDVLVGGVQPALQTLAALEDLQLVNMYDVTYNQADSFVYDGLHLNERGYRSLATAWKAAIQCNQNGICEAGENCSTCPGDCHFGKDFYTYTKCGNAYDPTLENILDNVPAELDFCNGDIGCILDGEEIGTDAAEDYEADPVVERAREVVSEARSLIPSEAPSVTPPSRTESNGDPHFRTWKNEHFESHGQCGVVMTSVTNFANRAIDFDIDIRTKIVVRYWSYIEYDVLES